MESPNPMEEYSNDDGDVSFCDFLTEGGVEEIAFGDSTTGSFDQEGFGFDFHFHFDFGWCGSTTDHVFPADDLFRHGRLLPLAPQRRRSESAQYLPVEKSISEYLVSWRSDSLDSQSSLWSTLSGSQRKTHGRISNSKSKGKQKPPTSGGKTSAIWRVLTLGLMKTPPVKLEDMHLRKVNNTNNIAGEKNLDLKLSVSCNYYKDTKLEEKEEKAVNFQEKWRTVKEDVVVVKKTPWLKGWKTLARLPSLQSGKA